MSAAVMHLTCFFGKINPNCSWNLRKATCGKFFVNMSAGLSWPRRKTTVEMCSLWQTGHEAGRHDRKHPNARAKLLYRWDHD